VSAVGAIEAEPFGDHGGLQRQHWRKVDADLVVGTGHARNLPIVAHES
jgi:hypothetical protein